jgi:hypothetical protein
MTFRALAPSRDRVKEAGLDIFFLSVIQFTSAEARHGYDCMVNNPHTHTGRRNMKTLVAIALLLATVATSSAQSFGYDPDPNVQFQINRDAHWQTGG